MLSSEGTELLVGDCLEKMQEIPDGSVDMVLADPPYGTTACKWDTVIDLERMWEQLKRIVKPNGAIVMTASQPFSSALVMSNPDMFRHEWVWIKNRGSNFLNTKREPMKEHETVLVFSRGSWVFNRQMEERSENGFTRAKMPLSNKTQSENYGKMTGLEQHYIGEMRVPRSYQKFKTVAGKQKTKHPTQKPVALMEYLIKTYTNEGETVLDFAMGSGTTGVACKNLNRNFIGIELDPGYFKIAKERIEGVQEDLFSALAG